jgi:putative transposase
MPQPIPLQPGSYYHIYNRGNNREDIFREERNYSYFMKLYAYHVVPIVDTFVYCLLRNHFHFLVRVKDLTGFQKPVRSGRGEDLTGLPDLSGLNPSGLSPSRSFANFFDAYAKAFNKAYGRTGALFQRPFGRIEVKDEAYLARLVVYIHHNSQRHGLIADFHDWPYSSYRTLLSAKPTQLQRGEVLAQFGGADAMIALHQRLVEDYELAALAPDDFD